MRISLVSSLAIGLVLVGAGGVLAQTEVLPDLTMLQPNEFRLELLTGGVRRIRFSTYIVNIGPGRFDAYGSEKDPSDPTRITRVTQRVQQGTGWVEHPTNATMFYAGDGHDHWHVFGLQNWHLAFQATPNNVLASGAKTGFCFWDNVNLSNAPRFYTGATECHEQTNGTVPMGLSVNWGDKYPWSIGFQYIDVSQLPYGVYCLTQVADPRGEFIEASTANNTIRTLIDIEPGGVTVLAPNCDTDVTPPAMPTGLTATPGDRTVALDWNDNSDAVARYNVYRGTTAIANPTSSNYSDTGLTNGTNYCYQVTALDAAGNESAKSSQACATPVGAARAVHVTDIDGAGTRKGKSSNWEVAVTVTIRDAADAAVSGATVSGNWSGGLAGAASGVTAGNGMVTLRGSKVAGTSVTFAVSNVTGAGLAYNPAANTDTDGTSNGTTITVPRP